MEFALYNNVKTFYGDVFDVLMGDEAKNMIILGNLIIGYEGKDTFGWRDPANWVMATVSDGGEVRLVALMTPPYNITMYATDEAAVKCLADGLVSRKIPVPGVVAEKSLAQAFALAYCSAKNMTHSITYSQRIYELRAVNPDVPKIGRFRASSEQDLSFLPYWTEDFSNGKVGENIEPYRYHVSLGKLYVLEHDGMAVSIAKITREMANSVGIGFVYTPPYLRGRGYASSVVAHISQLCLDRGFMSCILYTDLANPTSNSIYQKIGYMPICDSLEIAFS